LAQDNAPFLSICLIAKNEAKHLKRLVDSLDGIQDEIILVDTGSSDDTVEVAKSLGMKVYERPWDNSFCKARNFSCEHASGEWIFCPDCDEVIKKPHEFLSFLKRQDPAVNQVAMYLHIAWDHEGRPINVFPAQRCFRRGTHVWAGDIHEYLSPLPGVQSNVRICEEAWFEHHPDNYKSRDWYIEVLRQQANQNPKDPRALHYMGRECVYKGLYAEAIGYLERCLQFHTWDFERCQTRMYLADCYVQLGELDKAEEQLVLSMKEEPSRRDAAFKLAELYRINNRHDRAVIWYRMCTAIPKSKPRYFTSEDLYGALPFLRMAYSYWYLGDMKGALEAYNIAKEKDPNMPELIQNAHYFDFPLVSIIIPTRFRDEHLDRCLGLIADDERSYPNIEVIVVRDELDQPMGCPRAVNTGLSKANGDYIVFLGNDCLPQPGWLRNAMAMLRYSFPEGKGMVSFNYDHTPGRAQHFLIHKDVLKLLPYNQDSDNLKLFNEDYYHNYVDEELLAVMLYNNKYRWCPTARVLHSWYDDRGNSQGVEKREKDACDIYAEEHNDHDAKLFAERQILWQRDWTFGSMVMAFQDDGEDSYLEEVLVRLLEVLSPEDILGVMGPPLAVGYDPAFKDEGTRAIFDKYGIKVFWCDDTVEHIRRNKAKEQIDRDYIFIVDSDEIWDPEDLKKLKILTKKEPVVECWSCDVHNYWKSEDYRISPVESYKAQVLIKKVCSFVECRTTDASIVVKAPVTMHHMNYCRSVETIKRKIAFYRNPSVNRLHPVIDGWFENVWLKWTPELADVMENLHPTHPEAWKKAVKHNYDFKWRTRKK
jgi:glycosyltransferase involved in cell wall biosynthesis